MLTYRQDGEKVRYVMPYSKNINNNQEVNTTMERRFVKVTNIVRGISAVLCFEDEREARGFADELDVTLLQNSCAFEVSMLCDTDAYTLVPLHEDANERTHLTIIDHASGTVVEMTVSDYDTNYYVAESLNAVFTGTAFEAYAGNYKTYCLENKRDEEVTEPTVTKVLTLDDFMKACETHGGNWTAMMLSGIRKLAPDIFEALPDVTYSFEEVCFIVNHLCVDRPHLRAIHSLGSKNGVLYRTNEGTFAFRPMTDEEADMGTVALFEHLNGKVTD